MERHYYVYIMTNHKNSVLYTGVTNHLVGRVDQHKKKINQGFTKKYNLDRLVYFEQSDNIEAAILREKQIKGGSRQDKINLIESMNRDWHDLSNEL